jgi:CspA family cold shock protein
LAPRSSSPLNPNKKFVTGKVKWFDATKGFGFITPDDGSAEAFVHHTAIEMSGYRVLETGQPVEFKIKTSDKGPKAVNVRALRPAIAHT